MGTESTVQGEASFNWGPVFYGAALLELYLELLKFLGKRFITIATTRSHQVHVKEIIPLISYFLNPHYLCGM